MITVLTKWEPLCFLQGRSRSGGPFWLLFAAAGKESLARQWAKPQEQFKIAVNAKNKSQNTTTMQLASGARTAMQSKRATLIQKTKIKKQHGRLRL